MASESTPTPHGPPRVGTGGLNGLLGPPAERPGHKGVRCAGCEGTLWRILRLESDALYLRCENCGRAVEVRR